MTVDHNAPVSSDYGEEAAGTRSVGFGRPVVFGPSARPLVGRLHETVGSAVGVVILCSPWGYEENCAFATFRTLARRCAESGFEALRFDYDGCGNSWGDFADADRLASWLASVGEAIAYMRNRSDRPINLVGLRLGAALATLAGAQYSIDRMVLWDPVVTGRRYLRALRAMSMMGVDAGPDPTDPGGLVAIGHTLSSATVKEIEGLDLRSLKQSNIASALVIGRPGGSDPQRLSASLSAAGVACRIEELPGTDLLLDCAAEQSVIPLNIMERIVNFVTADPKRSPMVSRSLLPEVAKMEAPGTCRWTEEHFPLGSSGMAGVLTLPHSLQRNGVVLLVNNGVARSIGPARAWVEWARLWAGIGIASLRLDLSGLGDSESRPAQAPHSQYPIEAVDDFTDAVAELRARGLAPVIAVGLCSGAFLGLDAAAANAGLAGVLAINSQLFYVPDPPGSANRSRRAAPPTHPGIQRFLENTRLGRRVGREMPFPFWWILDRLGLQPSPLRGAEAARAATPVLLIYGEDNLGLQRLTQRDPIGLRKWQNDGGIVTIKGLDHSMFAAQIRHRVEERARSFLMQHLPARVT